MTDAIFFLKPIFMKEMSVFNGIIFISHGEFELKVINFITDTVNEVASHFAINENCWNGVPVTHAPVIFSE